MLVGNQSSTKISSTNAFSVTALMFGRELAVLQSFESCITNPKIHLVGPPLGLRCCLC